MDSTHGTNVHEDYQNIHPSLAHPSPTKSP